MGLAIGNSNSGISKIELKNADGTTSGTISITNAKKKKKKKLQYNFKEISHQIMSTKTAGNARQVAARARGKIAELRKKLKTGEYDDKELEAAISHAEQMERVARKRMKHLQEEERVKTEGGPCDAELEEELTLDWEDVEEQVDEELDMEELKELMQEFQDLMEESMEEMDEAYALDELSEELMVSFQEEMDPEDFELLKKKHRSDELREIMVADMKYLKALFDKLEKEKQEGSFASSGVSLELGGIEIPITNIEPPVLTEGSSVDLLV